MRLVFDIEANGLYWDVSEIYCLVAYDIDTKEVYKYTPDTIEEGIKLIINAKTLIGHNINAYDLPVIEKLYGATFTGSILDTLIVSRLMYPDIRQHPFGGNGLKNWGKHLGNDKIDFEDWSCYSEEMLTYCVQDVMLNYDIMLAQKAYIKDNEKIIRFETLVSKVCFKQHLSGFGYSFNEGVDLEQTLAIERSSYLDDLQAIFPDTIEERWSDKTGKQLKSKITAFNPQSNLQVHSRFIAKYPKVINKIPSTDKGNPQIDSIVLKDLSAWGIPEASKILTYRDNLKLEGQLKDWNDRASRSPDKRIHGEVNTQGAGTGRCTHANPNVAQVAKDKRMRALWMPGVKDYVQVGCDLSGLELRMLAHYMRDPDYTQEILNGDIHTLNQTNAGLETRDQAKTFIYAFLYGAGSKKIGSIVGSGSMKGKELIDNFLIQTPSLALLRNRVTQEAGRSWLRGLDNRKIWVRSPHSALNTKLQGAAAVVMKKALVLFANGLDKNVKIVANVHDEWQVECDASEGNLVGKLGVDAIIDAGKYYKLNCPLDGEYKLGNNWSETH